MLIQPEPTYRASTFKRENSQPAWQRGLASLPKAHALQSWAWADLKSRWGWQPIPLMLTIAESSWEPLAAAMVLKRPIPRTPFSMLYVPRGPALDYNDGALRRHVLAQLEHIGRQENAIFVKIDPELVAAWGEDPERKNPVGQKFVRELQARGWRFSSDQIQFRNTVEIVLDRPADELLAAMKSKTRYNIRLAGRKGVTVRRGDAADFPLMAEMYRETAERDGFTLRPEAYYLDAWRTFDQAGMIQPLIAEYEGQPLAAVLLVRFGERLIYMYGASTSRERNRMPTYLLQWEAIRWGQEQGCKIYDMWGAPSVFDESDPLWGVWRFKDGFQGQVVKHIGAWDYPIRPLLYWFFNTAKPKYLEFLRSRR